MGSKSDSEHAAVTASELSEILSTTAFTAAYGFELGEFGRGWCEIRAPYNPLFERPGGIVSGQVYMAAADVAAWFAIKTLVGADDLSVTIEMTTSFLEGLREADFVCRADVMKAGSVATFILARCLKSDGRILTHHTVRYLRSSKPLRSNGAHEASVSSVPVSAADARNHSEGLNTLERVAKESTIVPHPHTGYPHSYLRFVRLRPASESLASTCLGV